MTQQNSTQPSLQSTSVPAFKSSFGYATTTASEVANNWLLPDGVHDVLFADADKQQYLRHQLISQLQSRGYQLVTPPLIEFTESLLGNASEDLKRQTFKIIDQVTGRLMGVRADTTPQILRIDANHGGNDIARYCYAGHTIHTLPQGLFGLRTPLQLGAEIFGTDNILADFEMLDVVCELITSLKLNVRTHLDLGHVGIFKRLNELAELSEDNIEHLMQLYANKALPELKHACAGLAMGDDFYALARYGHNLVKLREALSDKACNDIQIQNAIRQVEQVFDHLQAQGIKQVSVDLADFDGYHYHSGMIFNVYLNTASQPILRGGWFDGLSNDKNGQARPAVGFSMDIIRLLPYFEMATRPLVLVNYADMQGADDKGRALLTAKVAELRSQGYSVVEPLTSADKPSGVSHVLKYAGEWVLEAI